MTPLNLTTPLNPINLCALCLSAPLRESKSTKRAPGSWAAADASSIWYNVDGSSEQPSTAEHRAGDRKLKLQDVKETKR